MFSQIFPMRNMGRLCALWGISGPYYEKPNLTLAEKSCLSTWILDLEFLEKYFCASQAHRKQEIMASN
jgi:hypothetical protein